MKHKDSPCKRCGENCSSPEKCCNTWKWWFIREWRSVVEPFRKLVRG